MAHTERANVNDTFFSSWQIYDQVSVPLSIFPYIFTERHPCVFSNSSHLFSVVISLNLL